MAGKKTQVTGGARVGNGKKKMGKMTKTLVTALVAVVVLAGAVAAINFIPEEEESSGSEDKSVVLFSENRKSITEVKVENESGGYTAVWNDGKVTIPALEGVPENVSLISALSLKATKITATQMITEDLSNEASYGLDEPRARVKISYGEGESFEIEFGDSAPGQAGVYAKCGGKIYITDATTAAGFLYSDKELANLALTPTVDIGKEMVIFGDITLEGSSRKETIKIRRTADENDSPLIVAAVFEMVEPHNRLVGLEATEVLFNSILNINATELLIIAPTEEEIKAHGLDVPYSSVKYMLYESEELTDYQEFGIYISEPDEEGYCNAMIEGSSGIYKIKYKENSLFDAEYKDMLDNMPVLPMIKNVAQLTVKFGEEEYAYTLDAPDEKTLNVSCRGETIDTENFRVLYQTILMLTGEEFVEGVTDLGDEYMTITYKYIDERYEDSVLRLYEGPVRRYYIEINGGVDFTVKAQRVEDIEEKCAKLQNGEDIELYY